MRSTFLEKEKMQPFVHLFIVFWLYTALLHQSSMSSNFLVMHSSVGISSRPTAFLFLIFLSTKSSCVNCSSLISIWLLIIFLISSSVTLGGFPRKFSKCCFHRCIRSSLLAAFSLALAVFFLLLTLFTFCHAIVDCLFSIESLIWLIWFWMYLLFF